ncbi:hypothetical protein [Alkalimarinus alittae]|uniref:Uncharacterized protein n=1 Tax=Alkalimarinus alittae TaxID=2961619 RepID=A0ABY6N587_9ALTE|nr:hypothetical protein [Alkalimarinus alittae]UZE97283.1 hypothetical protein NKI27_05900 [Alkalimarinus alittae]
MRWFKSPKYYPYIIVALASILMLVIINTGKFSYQTFPLALFLAAKLSILFGAVEVGLSYIGQYKEKEETYRAISRAISSFGMAICFVVLLVSFEAAKP